jgi:hypothetical protein
MPINFDLLRSVAAVATIAILALACNEAGFEGDGKLSERALSPSRRFVVHLGTIDASRRTKARFGFRGLPEREFTIGLEVASSRPATGLVYELRPISPTIRMTLSDEVGRVIVSESGPLKEWEWSRTDHGTNAFVFRRGVTRDVTVGRVAHPQREGLKADGGWGTSFSPRRAGRYALTVEVLNGDPNAATYNVTVTGQSGGWE